MADGEPDCTLGVEVIAQHARGWGLVHGIREVVAVNLLLAAEGYDGGRNGGRGDHDGHGRDGHDDHGGHDHDLFYQNSN